MLRVALAALALALVALAVVRWGQERSVRARRAVPVETRLAVMHALLSLVSRAGAMSGTRPFVVYGTLLGHARQRDFLCHDFDVDVGVMQGEYEGFGHAARQLVVSSPGYSLAERRLGPYRQYVITHDATGINADVFRFETDGRRAWRSVPSLYSRYVLRECGSTFPASWILPLRRGSMAGVDVYVPNDSDALLRCYYGPSYRTPDHTCDLFCHSCTKVA